MNYSMNTINNNQRQNSVYTPKSNLNQSFNDADGYRNVMNNSKDENSRQISSRNTDIEINLPKPNLTVMSNPDKDDIDKEKNKLGDQISFRNLEKENNEKSKNEQDSQNQSKKRINNLNNYSEKKDSNDQNLKPKSK